jgi:hypothetical protein
MFPKKPILFFAFQSLLFLQFSQEAWTQPVESSPTAASSQPATRPGPPSEIDQEKAMIDKYGKRFQTIREDLDLLQSRLEEGQKEIKNEADKLDSFLKIEEISSEEFTPYLKQWKVMRDSYRDVLENVNDNIDEVNQGRIRLESKYRLWQLKEGDWKMERDSYPKGKAPGTHSKTHRDESGR